MSEINYQLLAQELLAQSAAQRHGSSVRHKAVSSTPTVYYGHGVGGLFSSPALERPVISAMILPSGGIQSRLPLKSSMLDFPLYGIFTGVTATTGSEPSGPCDDFPVAGLSKLCTQTAIFGRQGRMSRVFELDRIGRLTDRGEHVDFQLLGGPFNGATNTANMPTIPGGAGGSDILNTEYAKAAFEIAVSWSRDFAREFYSGNPTNNVGTGRKYYRGLDLLINTGYRDAETGTACAAADSIVWPFGNRNIGTNAAVFVAQLTDVFRRLRYIASRTGLAPVKWVIGMRESMFYQVTEVWPCAYLTYRCTNVASGNTVFVDSGEAIAMRDEMRGNMDDHTGQFLWIDGAKVEVVIDDAITEYGIGGGEFRSDIYIVPLTVLGGVDATYMEYFNYDGPNGAMAMADEMGVGGFFKTSDDGRFLWHFKPPTNYCIQFQLKAEIRLVLRTPFLAARMTGVQYTPVQHERDPFTDSVYFVDGGKTDRIGYGPSYYSPTS